MDIVVWLRSLGLEQYEATFRDNAIDFSVLPDVTDQDLEKLGVLLGHRRELLRAIANLETSGKTAPSASTVPASVDRSQAGVQRIWRAHCLQGEPPQNLNSMGVLRRVPVLVGFVMANRTTHGGPQQTMVACEVSGRATDYCSFDATFGVCGNGGACEDHR
jgi:hypothetical protein